MDTADADRESCLSEFLGDDLGRGFQIQEAMTNNLSYEFIGTTIVPFGATPSTTEGCRTLLLIRVQ